MIRCAFVVVNRKSQADMIILSFNLCQVTLLYRRHLLKRRKSVKRYCDCRIILSPTPLTPIWLGRSRRLSRFFVTKIRDPYSQVTWITYSQIFIHTREICFSQRQVRKWQTASGIMRYIASYKLTDVSDAASTITPTMEAVRTCETWANFYEVTWNNTQEACHLNLHISGWKQINVCATSLMPTVRANMALMKTNKTYFKILTNVI
jgi:hypothetical protein